MRPAENADDGRTYSTSLKAFAVAAILMILFGGGWAFIAPTSATGSLPAGPEAELRTLARRLEPRMVAEEKAQDAAADAAALVRSARLAGVDPREALRAAFPEPPLLLGMLALDRDIDDFLDYARGDDAVGLYYRDEAKRSLEMRPLRGRYEAVFASAYTALSGDSAPAPRAPKRRRPYVAAPSEVWLPPARDLALSHPYALDVFFQSVAKSGEAEKGPTIRALFPGIVVASASDWSGGQGLSAWKGGGLSPAAGNGVVIYDPASRVYCSYFHLSAVSLPTGSVIEAGEVIGRGGNSGMNARKEGHGEHLHIEIFDTARDIPLRSYEILALLKK